MNEAKKDMNSYIWKGRKKIDEQGTYVQSEQRMVDMTQEDLKEAYEHCKTMLTNNDRQNPGRELVLKIITDQRNRCGAELFLRYMEQEQGTSRISMITYIRELLDDEENKKYFEKHAPLLDHAFKNLPDEFSGVPLPIVLEGALDMLGAFSKKHITRAFILRQGVWFTPQESQELEEVDQFGNPLDKIDVIRERLNIKDVERLYPNSKGLSYSELRAMMTLRPNKKYRDLTTMQLETLRKRLLFVLEEDIRGHIKAWEGRMAQIEEVVNYKGFKL